MNKEQIVHYYDTCESDYRLLWDLDHSHAMHAGYWDQQTKTLRDALKRENEILAEMVQLKEGERVLDAGCGVGGSSLFLAQQYQCHVVGITLSEKQVQTALLKAEKLNIRPLPSFQVMDYTKTSFADGSFDVIWGIESICHAADKSLFIKEAARLLRPGGRLIIADGFTASHLGSISDQKRMQRWLRGWGVDKLETRSAFEEHLLKSHFKNILFKDITSHVLPSSRRLYWYSWPAIGLSKVGEILKWRVKAQTENLHSARCQYQTLKKGLWQYGIFYAEKESITD